MFDRREFVEGSIQVTNQDLVEFGRMVYATTQHRVKVRGVALVEFILFTDVKSNGWQIASR